MALDSTLRKHLVELYRRLREVDGNTDEPTLRELVRDTYALMDTVLQYHDRTELSLTMARGIYEVLGEEGVNLDAAARSAIDKVLTMLSEDNYRYE